MTLRHLRIFVEVVNCGKMSEAASKLYISQPSISQTISELENYYNVKLFDRLSKKLYLTAPGKELYEMASKIVLAYDEMDRCMSHATDKQELKLGATFTVSAIVMMRLLRQFDEKYKNITARLVVDRTKVLEHQLLSGELDAAIVEGTIKSSDLVVKDLMKDELVLACPITHPFHLRSHVKLRELEGMDFIMREQASKTRRIFEENLEREHITVKEKWTCNNPWTIKAAVTEGYGLSILSERYIRNEVRSGQIAVARIEGITMERTFSLAYHKNKYKFPAFLSFLKICDSLSQREDTVPNAYLE